MLEASANYDGMVAASEEDNLDYLPVTVSE